MCLDSRMSGRQRGQPWRWAKPATELGSALDGLEHSLTSLGLCFITFRVIKPIS